MDTNEETAKTDKLGRRSGPRRQYKVAEKLAMVEETTRRGASVADVAQRHAVNANQIFTWRRLVKKGLLSDGSHAPATLLPVKVATPTLMPTERSARERLASKETTAGLIEIEFPGGRWLRLRGRVDRATLIIVMSTLSRR